MPKPAAEKPTEHLAAMVSSTIQEPIEVPEAAPFDPNFMQYPPPPPMFMGQPPISQNFMMQDQNMQMVQES